MRFLDLPAADGVEGPSIGDTKVTPFYTGVASLKFIAPLFDDPDGADESDSDHLVGGLTFALSYVVNHVADATLSQFFETPASGQPLLKKTTHNLSVDVGVQLGGITSLTLSATPWSSDSRLGKRFAVALNLVRPTRAPQKSTTTNEVTPPSPPPPDANGSNQTPTPPSTAAPRARKMPNIL